MITTGQTVSARDIHDEVCGRAQLAMPAATRFPATRNVSSCRSNGFDSVVYWTAEWMPAGALCGKDVSR